MTSTAGPNYIRDVGVRYPRCPSSTSVRSTLSATNYVIQRQRPHTAAEVVHSARHEAERIVERERTEMLDELMFLYGRNVSNSFNFSASADGRRWSNNSLSFNSPWGGHNNAFSQMYRASGRYPRHRLFPHVSLKPLVKQGDINR